MASADPPPHAHAWRRAALILLLCAAVAVIATLDVVHAPFVRLLAYAEHAIAARPIAGPALFVLIAALSGMLAFLSSAVIVPVAVYAWGPTRCALLLWLGWTLGGAFTYAAGRFLGRPLVGLLVPKELIARYERRIGRDTPFVLVMLFQLAMPSEVPGYILGVARYSFFRYLIVVILGELPFAFGTVWLGESFIRREVVPVLLIGAAAAAFSVTAYVLLHRRIHRHEAHDRQNMS
ncbi:MAG TPA: VTT domain-containing protein [Nannocystis sp.]